MSAAQPYTSNDPNPSQRPTRIFYRLLCEVFWKKSTSSANCTRKPWNFWSNSMIGNLLAKYWGMSNSAWRGSGRNSEYVFNITSIFLEWFTFLFLAYLLLFLHSADRWADTYTFWANFGASAVESLLVFGGVDTSFSMSNIDNGSNIRIIWDAIFAFISMNNK